MSEELLKRAEDELFGVRESFEQMIECRNTGARIRELAHRDDARRKIDNLATALVALRREVTG